MDFAVALDYLSDDGRPLTELSDLTEHGFDERWSNRQNETDAHVEHPIHLFTLNGTMVLEEVEDGRDLPAVGVDDRIDVIRKHSIEIARKAPTGDVGHRGDHLLDSIVPEDIHDCLTVDASRLEEDLTQSSIIMSPELLVATMQIQRGVIDDLSNQRVAVAVHTTAGQSDEYIIRLDPQWIRGTIQFNDADRETGYVEVPLRIDVRHFRALAADQSTACDLTTSGDARDDSRGDFGVLPIKTEIVEEEKRLGTLDDEIVDVHRDTVDADRVVRLQLGRQLHLGSDTVGTRGQYRIPIVALEELLVEIQAEQASESTHGTHDPRTMSSFECRLHHGHGSITSIDIDT